MYVFNIVHKGKTLGCNSRLHRLFSTFNMSSLNGKRKTGYIWDERFSWHNTGTHAISVPAGLYPEKCVYVQQSSHIESVESKQRLHSLLSVCGILEQCEIIKSRKATRKEVERIHTAKYLDRLQSLSDKGGADIGNDAVVSGGSYNIALYAAGSCITAVSLVLSGMLKNAYCLVRPPGHHAERDRGMGFCLINNIAVAAEAALVDYGAKRVAIVDWDVHHGNGTEQAFYERDDVLFISMHQDNLYPPNSGLFTCTGKGKGEGYNINIPLPPGTGNGGYMEVMKRVVLPSLYAFHPDIILISCGFDAGALDPLGRMMLSSSMFGTMAEQLVLAANELCEGRIVACHEGGYSPCHVPFCGLRVVEAFSGIRAGVSCPYDLDILKCNYHGLLPHQNAVIQRVEEQVEKLMFKHLIVKNGTQTE